jgi:hypothetical protein
VGKWAALIALSFLLTACGSTLHDVAGSDLSASQLSSGSAAGLKAFQTGFYAFANSQGCVKCHGAIQNPRFASPNLGEAYAAARGAKIGSTDPLIDFTNPDASIIVEYAGNSHCNDTPCANPANSATVQSLLEAWASAEVSGGVVQNAALPPYMTASMQVPANVPNLTVKNPAVMRFSLSSLGVPALSGAILEIEVQKVNTTQYRIGKPKIAGNSAAVMVNGIHLYIKDVAASGVGTQDASQGLAWTSLSASAPVFALPTKLPTTPLTATPLTSTYLAVQAASATGADVFTIGFDGLN